MGDGLPNLVILGLGDFLIARSAGNGELSSVCSAAPTRLPAQNPASSSHWATASMDFAPSAGNRTFVLYLHHVCKSCFGYSWLHLCPGLSAKRSQRSLCTSSCHAATPRSLIYTDCPLLTLTTVQAGRMFHATTGDLKIIARTAKCPDMPKCS